MNHGRNQIWVECCRIKRERSRGGYSVDFIFYCVAFPQCDSVSRWFLLQPQPLQVSEGTGCVLAVSSTRQRRINKRRLAFAGFTASPASENTGETIKPSGNPNQIVWKAIESVKMSRFFTSTNVLGLIAAVVIIIRQRQPQQSQVINHPFWNSYKWTYTIRIWSLVTNRFMDNEGSLQILVVISNIWNRKQMELASCQRPDESVWCPSVRIETVYWQTSWTNTPTAQPQSTEQNKALLAVGPSPTTGKQKGDNTCRIVGQMLGNDGSSWPTWNQSTLVETKQKKQRQKSQMNEKARTKWARSGWSWRVHGTTVTAWLSHCTIQCPL